MYRRMVLQKGSFLKRLVILSFYLLLFFSLSPLLFGGTTGKITGKVIDRDTGKPLMGVNITIEGTLLGAATDQNGEYIILQIPPGTYSVRASMIGYSQVLKKNVQVKIDLTTRVDFQLSMSAIETGEIIVTAVRPMVKADETTSKRSTSKEEMAFIPNATSTTNIVALMPGVIVPNTSPVLEVGGGQTLKVRDENIKDVHIRGGGGGEVLYQIDGMPVTHPIFGGHSVLNLDINSVEEVEVLTGGFNAEYGQAQSGVVNIVTKEGSDVFGGYFQIRTDDFIRHPESENYQYISFNLEGPDPFFSYLFPSLGISFLKRSSFFLSTSITRTNTRFNNHRPRDFYNFLNLIRVKERQSNNYVIHYKLITRPTQNLKFILTYSSDRSRSSPYNWWAKNILDSLEVSESQNKFASLSFTHTLSKNTFYNLNFAYLNVQYYSSFEGKTPGDFWHWTSDSNYTGANFFTDIDHDYFVDIGEGTDYRKDYSTVLTVKGDITSQVNNTNLMKAGFEFNYKDLSYINIQQGGWYLTDYGRYVFLDEDPAPRSGGPFPEYGLYRWLFKAYPKDGSFYIQDKIERLGLVINVGLRMDWFTPGATVETKRFKERWESATGLKLRLKKFRYYLSPRLGISFPISTRMVMYFSYGHFQQMPSAENLFRDPYESANSFCGNPNLEPEKTVAYEYGFAYQFTTDMAIDIKGYSKDISNTVNNGFVQAEHGKGVYLAQNMGYGRTRGLEINLKRRHSRFISGLLTYTLQWASGYTSSPYELYQRSQTDLPLPIREERLSWDIRHVAICQLTFSLPKGKKFDLFGFSLPSNWSATFYTTYSSGLPYTPGSTALYVPPNSATAPYTLNTDFRFEKRFEVGRIKVGLTLDITNLFDRKNVTLWGFNNWTGKPYKYGDLKRPYLYYYSWKEMVYLRDPRMFEPGRRFICGINMDF